MAKKTYTVGKDGVDWATAYTGAAVEEGAEVEVELQDSQQETALVAAGWLEPADKGKKGDK